MSQISEVESLDRMPPFEAARELMRLAAFERAEVFGGIPERQATAVFGFLDKACQQQLVERLPAERILRLVESLDPDDRAQLLDELPAPTAHRLLSNLSPHERRMTAELLGFPEESAGRVMTPEFLALEPGMTAAQALEKIRRQGATAETVYVLPLLDGELHLLGLVYLKDLVLAPGDRNVEDLADTTVRPLEPLEDREVAARLIQATDTLAAPVVDKQGRLLGLVTVDDAMDILDREVESSDMLRVLLRESVVGLLLGAMLAAIGVIPLGLFAGGQVALVVALTLVVICGLASTAGAVVPLLAHRVGIDPAVASAPFITTLIDAAGLLVYFLIARIILF